MLSLGGYQCTQVINDESAYYITGRVPVYSSD